MSEKFCNSGLFGKSGVSVKILKFVKSGTLGKFGWPVRLLMLRTLTFRSLV